VEQVGSRVRQLRTDSELTQQELSDLTGIERDKIAKIEAGTRRMNGTEVLFLAEALGVTPRGLLGVSVHPGRYRGPVDLNSADAASVSEWFDEFIEDVMFVERSAMRHGLD
jgi:transcriptional regulator with XRE-family HTH domain